MELDYLQGLQRLRDLLPQGNDAARAEFFLLEARLRRNLSDRQQYGRDDTNAAQFARLIETLNAFLRTHAHLDLSFLDLCQQSPAHDALYAAETEEAAPVRPPRKIALWQAGEHLSVQGQDYWIDGPVQQQWLDRQGALYQQAPGRHAPSGQATWLKQCQCARPSETALTLQRDLEKEGRLLVKLQQTGRRDFPRWLGSERTEQSVTLVAERLVGRSLAAVVATLPQPLDQQAIRRLLAGRQTLIQLLHALHTDMRCSHRMLTPETLLLQAHSGHIILSDVGLAARTLQPGEGPQHYQAPEQVRGLPAPGRATDIYQLGALFYHLFTGQYITDAARGCNLAPELETMLRRAACANPADRWPDVHAFSRALRQAGY